MDNIDEVLLKVGQEAELLPEEVQLLSAVLRSSPLAWRDEVLVPTSSVLDALGDQDADLNQFFKTLSTRTLRVPRENGGMSFGVLESAYTGPNRANFVQLKLNDFFVRRIHQLLQGIG